MGIAAISVSQAQDLVTLGDSLTAFLEMAKDKKKWKAISSEVSIARAQIEQGRQAAEKVREVENGLKKLVTDSKGVEAALAKAVKVEGEALAKAEEVKERELSIIPMEKAVAKADRELAKRENAVAVQESKLLGLVVEAEDRIKGMDAKQAELDTLISKYNKALGSLQAAKV